MTLFARPVDLVDHEPVCVMQATCPDELAEIQRLWPWFEELVGLRGRRMYAVADETAATYTTCTPVRPDDDPAALGLEVGALPGGRFRRGRLRGEPPAVYAHIAAGFEELATQGDLDRSRPLVEFYRRRDQVELWLPVTTGTPRP